MAIDPATAKLAIRLSIKLISDEEFRKKIVILTIMPMAVLIMLIALPFYLLTHPIETMGIVNASEISLVKNFQDEYGYYGDDAVIDISSDYSNSNIPLFLQYDKRWGMYSYGTSGTISNSGCGPTSLAMIIVGLTGNTSVNPKVVSDWSYKNGYRVEGLGSSWSLFPAGAKNWGIECNEIPIVANAISTALHKGNPVIASMGVGHFTNSGHFIVLRGITENGKILVNDPNSVQRSLQEWDVGIILREAKGAWSFNAKP